MIEFANGRKISRVAISTALGTSGDGMFPYTWWPEYRSLLKLINVEESTIFSKSSTRQPRVGNFIPRKPSTWKYIQRLPGGGMLNAYGLTNAGVEANAKKTASSCSKGFEVIPNIYPQFEKGLEIAIEEARESLDIFKQYLGPAFWAVEISYSCPNSAEDISKNMDMAVKCTLAMKKHYPDLVLIIKTSIVHPLDFYPQLVDSGADVIHAVNTVPYKLAFSEKTSPLQSVGGGGVSGGPVFEMVCNYNEKVREVIPKTPLIMGCGVVNLSCANNFFNIGADAISLCTVALRDPLMAKRIICCDC